MSATITFTDSIGTATLSNIPEIPVERFDGWTPDVNSVGDEAFALGTGQLYKFEYRVDDLVSFRIANLKGDQLTYCRRLKLHLLRGGEVTVSATNELNELYTTCTLAPDTRPTISEPNADREYTFSVTLRAGEGVPDATPSGSAEDEFGIVPGLILDWDAEAEVSAGHVDSEPLPLLLDQSGQTNHGHQTDSTYQPVLKTAQLNSLAIFDLTSNKGAHTTSKVAKLTDGVTVFQVRKYVTHVEHNFLCAFDKDTPDGGNVIAVQESTNVAPGSQSDRAAQFGSIYIDADGTVWHVLALRFTGHTLEMFYNDVLQEMFNGVTGASIGMAFGYAGGWNGESLAYHNIGTGKAPSGGVACEAQLARNLIWGRSLSDTEVVAVSSHLRVLYGL